MATGSEAVGAVKQWIGAITDLGLMLLALAIVATVLVGGNALPFFGGVVGNMTALVKDLGSNGLVGLIVLGLIIWLFSGRSTR